MSERTYSYGKTSYYNRYNVSGSLAVNPQEIPATKESQKVQKKVKLIDQPAKLAVIAFTLIVAGIFLIICRTAIIGQMNSQIAAQKEMLNVICSQNEQTTVELDRTTDLKYVEEVAKNKLNMNVPKTEQKIYIDVNITDSVELPAKASGGFVKGVKNFIGGCLEYLY